uniref:Calpain catalytic domain-containing protein n=1 Tax=Macrostomum lignano TaxID=282301 RepID=A0A1I8FI16_9PLAT
NEKKQRNELQQLPARAAQPIDKCQLITAAGPLEAARASSPAGGELGMSQNPHTQSAAAPAGAAGSWRARASPPPWIGSSGGCSRSRHEALANGRPLTAVHHQQQQRRPLGTGRAISAHGAARRRARGHHRRSPTPEPPAGQGGYLAPARGGRVTPQMVAAAAAAAASTASATSTNPQGLPQVTQAPQSPPPPLLPSVEAEAQPHHTVVVRSRRRNRTIAAVPTATAEAAAEAAAPAGLLNGSRQPSAAEKPPPAAANGTNGSIDSTSAQPPVKTAQPVSMSANGSVTSISYMHFLNRMPDQNLQQQQQRQQALPKTPASPRPKLLPSYAQTEASSVAATTSAPSIAAPTAAAATTAAANSTSAEEQMPLAVSPTISESPCLLIREKRSRELCHGSLGTCWVPAVAAALLIWPEYAEKAMPDLRSQEQELLDPVRFTGAFHFRLHFNDEPYRVVIDDRLPRSASSSSPSSSMLFAHSPDSGEYFAPLLEKAIAKLFGSYRALESLTLEQGLECATGGLCHSCRCQLLLIWLLTAGPAALRWRRLGVSVFERLQTELEQRSLLLLKVAPASVDAAESVTASSDPHSETKHGLVPCHAYLVTGTHCVAADPLRFQDLVQMAQQRGDPARRHRFVRVRNPAGQRRGSLARPVERGLLRDGQPNFSELIVCRVHNLSVLSMRNTWHETVFRGSWTEWLSGGCLEKGGRPLTNPQYMLDVTNPNLELDISLSQRFEATPHDLVSMGLLLVKVESNREYRAHRLDFCQVVHHTACSSAQRITLGLHLEPGRYILLPCTEIASQEAFFTLRIYSRGASCNARELVADQPLASLCFAFTAYPEVGSSRLSARGLPRSRPWRQPLLSGVFRRRRVQGSNPGPRQHSDPEWNEPLVCSTAAQTSE